MYFLFLLSSTITTWNVRFFSNDSIPISSECVSNENVIGHVCKYTTADGNSVFARFWFNIFIKSLISPLGSSLLSSSKRRLDSTTRIWELLVQDHQNSPRTRESIVYRQAFKTLHLAADYPTNQLSSHLPALFFATFRRTFQGMVEGRN